MEQTFNKERTDMPDRIGGKRYWEDVRRSRMNGADPERAQKMAFRVWRDRNFGNVGNVVLHCLVRD